MCVYALKERNACCERQRVSAPKERENSYTQRERVPAAIGKREREMRAPKKLERMCAPKKRESLL